MSTMFLNKQNKGKDEIMINFGIRFRSLAETSNFLNISDAFRDHFISLYGSKKLKPKLL